MTVSALAHFQTTESEHSDSDHSKKSKKNLDGASICVRFRNKTWPELPVPLCQADLQEEFFFGLKSLNTALLFLWKISIIKSKNSQNQGAMDLRNQTLFNTMKLRPLQIVWINAIMAWAFTVYCPETMISFGQGLPPFFFSYTLIFHHN